ncbi:MAG: HD domain-containing protein, partial [candidate division Zixibacteria bacterium]|nr:HD domain-containing protein [candidate division Zixibacteria bacterium]
EYNEKKFLSLEFGDSGGRITGVWWEPERFAFDDLEEGMVVKVKGNVQQYRGKNQLQVQKMRLAKDEEYNLADLLPHSVFTIDELKNKVIGLSEKVENSHISKLMESFWNDDDFFDAYLRAAAGKLWHHSYIGGLAEHSINVTELCIGIARRYDFIDRDLLIFGGLFHDMGKLSQYKITSFIDYTDEGRLIGHISWADHVLASRAESVEAFPPKLLMKLRHLILSHHGQIDFASPVVPQIPEAFILYYADELDSKMGAINRIREKNENSGWSEYVHLLGRHLYFGEKK